LAIGWHWIAPAAAEVGPRGDRALGQYLTQLEQDINCQNAGQPDDFPMDKKSGGPRTAWRCTAAYFGVRDRTAFGYVTLAQVQFVQIAVDDHRRLFAQPRF
jgi:hypothetical protein